MVTFSSQSQVGLNGMLILLLLALFEVNCSEDDASTTLSPKLHRGAARQMYGSGSLRPAGSKPVYATGQKHHGERTTMSPKDHRKILIPPVQPYPLVPFRYPVREYEPGGFPIFVSPENIARTRSGLPSSGGFSKGMYGGRTEFYGGKPTHSVRKPKYPFDFGFIPGRGFAKIPDYDIGLGRLPPVRGDSKGISRSVNLKFPEEEEVGLEGDNFGRDCGKICRKGEFLCTRTCMCIKQTYRCDGDSDCEDNEDEIDCEEILRHKCNETENYVRCPTSGKCILKDWLCDGDDDCGDFSDESHCGLAVNCTNDQFECANGLCIPLNWVCDNDIDCKDFSDEMNCTKDSCTEDEFECGDGSCISMTWKCDRQIDCTDGSDEAHCDITPPFCTIGNFQCATQKCIKMAFKCDGDDDCGDWSDEDDCEIISGNCVSGEFKCKSGKCIPERYRCDKEQDCEDNDDEANCDPSVIKSCSPDEYTCQNGACILKKWVCDGYDDCSLGEDEDTCEIICDETKFPCASPEPNSNATEYCINKKHVCDGQRDCPKGEDEHNCPTKRDCERGTKCSQLCIKSSKGENACACQSGYNLAKDGTSCEDIDECLYEVNPVCSQKCTNTIGSFKCGCMTGYVLRPDLRSCKAVGGSPTLLFANRKDIRQVSLSNAKYTALLKGLHNAIALDYHYEKRLIFWSDVAMDVIRRAYINGSGVTDIIKWGLESPGGIALDWTHDLIFWTDAGTRRIEVATLDGKNRAIVAADDVDKPRAIAVHPKEALVFWTDWGPNPKIERSEMDGSNRKSIVTQSVFWPNGLTIDYTSSSIYWADAKHNVIETSHLDGSNRRKVISKGLPHPFALTIFEDALYWTDWHTKSISTANKATGAGFRTIHSNLHFPMDIHSYHPQRQPAYKNHCGGNNGGCAHMCLPTAASYTCTCRLGQKLGNDKKSCQKPEKMLFFARKKDLRIKHLDPNALHEHEMVIPVDGIKSAVAIAWDSKTDSIFWTDVERDTINKAFWNGSNQEVLVHTNLLYPAGLALDWVTDKLYWTDAEMFRIEVMKINGDMRSLLIWEGLHSPRDIVVDPLSGYMYWTDWGDIPRIERAAMDGTMRKVVVKSDLTWPSGLSIDHDAGKLYWTKAGMKAIEYSKLDGTDRKILLSGDSLPHPFGLDVYGNNVYWTDVEANDIEKVNKVTGANRTILGTKITGLMDVKVFHRNRKGVKSACDTKNGGCSHLCLLKPKGHSCVCPTGIKLAADGKTCQSGITNYLIVAHRIDIRQISLDVPYVADVVLPLPQLKMTTSVDVDRKTGEIYWSDTAEDVIQKSTPDGKNMQIVIMHELLTPDGIAIDSTGRKIYWTDGDRNSVEVAELDGSNRRVLICTDLDKPRAITLHYHNGLLFWSDWGAKPKIEVAQMDGVNRKTLISKDLQWPNGLAIDRPAGRLYWNDGKLMKIESCLLNGKDRKKIIQNAPHPYGLVVVGNHIYWTDWKTQSLHRADKKDGGEKTVIRDKLEGLMDVRSVQSDNISENACGSNNGGCSHLCLRNPTTYTCACPTGLRMTKNSTKICETLPSTYLLISTRFAISRISFDTEELWDVTLPIKNINNVIDIDFHYEKKMVYYTDLENHVIRSVNMKNMSDVRNVVYSNLASPDGIAVDWIANNIYWTNTGNKIIEVARLDGTNRKVIINDDLNDPRSIAVFPRKGYLYWTDWENPKIERSLMDGSARKVIVGDHLSFPVGLVVDYVAKRLYWIDAKPDAERIETSDLHGGNRVILSIQSTSPFALTQFGDHIYWTDWKQKSVIRADKTSGKDAVTVRTNLDAAMGLTMVSQSRQLGWNPCAVNNGGCSHLCFFLLNKYSCGCPDGEALCSNEPKTTIPNKCPGDKFKCDYEDEDEEAPLYYNPINNDFDEISEHADASQSNTLYIMILIPLLCIVFLSIIFVVLLLIKKGKEKYLYAASRSFSNPNYYSSNNDASNNMSNAERRQFIWKRLKYDKSQERVYEETVGTNSPEITSLIPTILTPCSSNCEAVTPELERSPSATPLHKLDIIQPVA